MIMKKITNLTVIIVTYMTDKNILLNCLQSIDSNIKVIIVKRYFIVYSFNLQQRFEYGVVPHFYYQILFGIQTFTLTNNLSIDY